jgi:hypothetical protein
MSAKPLWQCPVCGRSFKNKNQWHSHNSIPVESHFKGKPPVLKETYETLVKKAQDFGPTRIDAVKSGINLGARSHFAMVYVLKNSLKLEFLLNRKLVSKRILRTQDFHGHFIHYLRLSEPMDVDEELIGWLKEAYQLKKQIS